jgi:hypothetical protein
MSAINIIDKEELLNKLESVENKMLERGDISDYVPANFYDFSINVVEFQGSPHLAIDIFSDEDGFDPSEVNWKMVTGTVIDRLEDSRFFGLASEALDQNVDTDRVICLSADDFVQEVNIG